MADIVAITTAQWDNGKCATPSKIGFGGDGKDQWVLENRPEWSDRSVLFGKRDDGFKEFTIGREHVHLIDTFPVILTTNLTEADLEDMITELERALRTFGGDSTYKLVKLLDARKQNLPFYWQAKGRTYCEYGGKDV